jgi:uncharacterized protein (DUF305 family)
MKIESVRDILEWTMDFHKQLASCLTHCEPNNSERSKMAMQYLIAHEEHLAALIKSFSVEYLEKNPIVLHEHCDGAFEQKADSEIAAIVIEQHQEVIALYSYLREQAVIPHHKELLDNLLALENQEIVRMAQGLNRFQDM